MSEGADVDAGGGDTEVEADDEDEEEVDEEEAADFGASAGEDGTTSIVVVDAEAADAASSGVRFEF